MDTEGREEKRGIPSLGGEGLVGTGRQTGAAMGWMRWELAWSMTRHPQHPLGQGPGLGPAQAGAPHTKTN